MPNPWTIVAALVVTVILMGTSATMGYKFARGQAAREEVLIAKAADAAQLATAGVLSKLEQKAGPIRERVTKEIRTEVRYTDCVNTPAVMEQINKARQP